jgi:hypothetical protein
MSRILNLLLATAISSSLSNSFNSRSYAKEAKIIPAETKQVTNTENEADNKEYVVKLKNGTILPCKILEKDYKGLKILSPNLGEFFIPLAEIESIKEKVLAEENISSDKNTTSSVEDLKTLESVKDKLIKKEAEITVKKQLETEIKETQRHVDSLEKGTKIYWFPNPNDTRHFFAPTARPLGQGNGYLQDIGVLIGGANYGITDNLSVGFMASLIPFIDVTQQLLAFTPKVGFNINDNFSIGGGAVYLSGAGLAQMGVIYGVTTIGNTDTNLSLAVGGALGNISRGGALKPIKEQDIITGANAFIGMVGGMHRIFETVSIVSENWIVHDSVSQKNTFMFSYGFRFFSENSSWDLGIVYPMIPTISTFPLPYVDFVWDF